MFEVVCNEEIAPQASSHGGARAARGARPQARTVRHRARRRGCRAHPAHDRRRRSRGGHHHAHHPGGRAAARRNIVAVPVGGALRDVAGPLGQPTHIANFGKVVCVGGGAGTAVLFPLAKALARGGQRPDDHHRRPQRALRRAARRARRLLERAALHHRGRLARREGLRHAAAASASSTSRTAAGRRPSTPSAPYP